MNPEVNETNVENPQDGIGLSNDELAAAMGFITTIGDQNMMAQQEQTPEEPTSPGNEPGTAQQPNQQEQVKAEITGLEDRLMSELQTLREDMKAQGDGKAELADLKKQIELILNSSD